MNFDIQNKWRDSILIIIFVLVISVPGGIMLFQSSSNFSPEEKRARVDLPHYSILSYSRGDFQERYESFFNDHFGLRGTLVRANSSLLYNGFQTSSNDKILIGNEGWMFYSAEGMIDEYMNGNTLSEKDLKDIGSYFNDLQEQLSQRGIVFVLLIAPDKETIYSEYMPRRIEKSLSDSTREVFVDYMRSHTAISVFDPTETLIEEKKNDQLYHIYDSHWTEKGASIAYQLLHQFFKEQYALADADDQKLVQSETENKDLAELLFIESEVTDNSFVSEMYYEDYIQDRYTRHDNDVMEIKGEDNDPCLHALVFRDSFGTQFLSSLRQDMCQITVLRDYSDLTFIQEKNPDVIILEIAERNLPRLVDGEHASPR